MTEALNVSPDMLHANPWNTNFVSPENEEKLDEAVRRFGFFKPIVVREREEGGFEIIGGEHRWQSAVRLGLKEVPVMNLGLISDTHAKEISLADNARYGSDDTIALAELFRDLGDTEGLQSILPYTDEEVNQIFSAVDIAVDDLDLSDSFEDDEHEDLIGSERPAKAAKTHTIMRFKVSNEDAERLGALIENTQKKHGLSETDSLTNAGDALVFLLLSGADAE